MNNLISFNLFSSVYTIEPFFMLYYILYYYINLLLDDKYAYIFTTINHYEKQALHVCSDLSFDIRDLNIRGIRRITKHKTLLYFNHTHEYIDHTKVHETVKNHRKENKPNEHTLFNHLSLSTAILLFEIVSLDEILEELPLIAKEAPIILFLIPNDYYYCIYMIKKCFKEKCHDIASIILATQNSKLLDQINNLYNDNKTKPLNILQKDIYIINKRSSENLNDSLSTEKIIQNNEVTVSIAISIYRNIERIFSVTFYFLLITLMIISFLTLQVWLKNQNTKNPLITPYELNQCKTKKYKEIKNNQKFTDCLICMESYEESDICRILICEHFYHKECVDPWLKSRSSRCPYCRELIKIDDHF